MLSQAPDLTVEFVQKVYSENVLHVRHDVWDVHTNVDRWWVITEPMNLYAQEQFPNMDLALTFHVGLCLRIPRSDRKKLSEIPAEPFVECVRSFRRHLTRSRRPKRSLILNQSVSDAAKPSWLLSAWHRPSCLGRKRKRRRRKRTSKHGQITSAAWLSRGIHTKHRRHLFKTLLESAWEFANWLTHTKSSNWHDAEAAFAVTENAIGLCISAVIRHMRGVPEQCPACGSQRLSPERGYPFGPS